MLNIQNIPCTLESLVRAEALKPAAGIPKGEWDRIKNLTVNAYEKRALASIAPYLGVTEAFRSVIQTFKPEAGVIPAGFRPEFVLAGDCLQVDLKRDISYSENGVKRPTKVLFSADSANPYEIAPLKNFIANLTCNPALLYDGFIHNPNANIGNTFRDRYEVMGELCRVLGPGADISIEIDDPFADEAAILEEIQRFEEILTPYRLVIKVPHTGPINRENAQKLLDGSFDLGYEDGTAADNLRGHNLAYRLAKKGYRVNFTLMFEPYQVALALQARPYFINTFIKQRYNATLELKRLLQRYDGGDKAAAEGMREVMRPIDMLSLREAMGPEADIVAKARETALYRHAYDHEGEDGLDSTRHALRVLRNSYLEGTRLIICSMSAAQTYKDIDKLLAEEEFQDMVQRVVITAPPHYLARFTSAAGILSYQRLFLKAAAKKQP